MIEKKRIQKVIRHMNRKPMNEKDYKKENWKCKCDRCGNIQEYTENFKCKKCSINGNIERSLIRYLK